VRCFELCAGTRLEEPSFKAAGRNTFEAGEKAGFGLIRDGSAQQTRQAHERLAVARRTGAVQRLVDDQFTVGAQQGIFQPDDVELFQSLDCIHRLCPRTRP
jgi:hypothetical protein